MLKDSFDSWESERVYLLSFWKIWPIITINLLHMQERVLNVRSFNKEKNVCLYVKSTRSGTPAFPCVLYMHDELLWNYTFYEYSGILATFGSVRVGAISIAIWVNFLSFSLNF